MALEEKKRKWQPRELRLCSEYVSMYHSKARILTRVRLGPFPSELLKFVSVEEESKMITVWRRWADAIAIYPDKVVIIETAIRPNPGKIMQLLLYKDLFYKTPEFDSIKHLPVELELVYAIEDPATIELAKKYNIKTIYFKPAWIEEYINILYPRERRGPIQEVK
jgi:hypothetical protein